MGWYEDLLARQNQRYGETGLEETGPVQSAKTPPPQEEGLLSKVWSPVKKAIDITGLPAHYLDVAGGKALGLLSGREGTLSQQAAEISAPEDQNLQAPTSFRGALEQTGLPVPGLLGLPTAMRLLGKVSPKAQQFATAAAKPVIQASVTGAIDPRMYGALGALNKIPGVGQALHKWLGVAFTGDMGAAAYDAAHKTAQKFSQEGISPATAGAAMESLISAGFAGLGAYGTSKSFTKPPGSLTAAEAKGEANVDKVSQNYLSPLPSKLDKGMLQSPKMDLVTPEVSQNLQGLFDYTLREANSALVKGPEAGFTIRTPGEVSPTPIQKVVLLDGDVVPLPDGSTQQIAGNAGVIPGGDTVYITKLGQASVLQAADEAGVLSNIKTLVAHEVSHPTAEAGKPTGWVNPEAPARPPSGHAEGAFFDDSMVGWEQQMREFELLQALDKSPTLNELASLYQQTGKLRTSLTNPSYLSPTAGTYTAPDLAMGTFLKTLLPGGEKITPPVGLFEAQRGTLGMPEIQVKELPTGIEPTKLGAVSQSGAKRIDPEKLAAEMEGKETQPPRPDLEKPRPMMGALLNKAQEAPPEFPNLRQYVERSSRGKLARGPYRVKYLDLLKELEEGFQSGKLASGEPLERAGVAVGGLEDFARNIRQAIYNTYGQRDRTGNLVKDPETGRVALKPEGVELYRRLNQVIHKAPRYFGQGRSSQQIADGVATPRTQNRVAGRIAKSEARVAAYRLDRDTGRDENIQALRQQAKKRAADAIRAARAAGAEPTKEGLLTRLNDVINSLFRVRQSAHLLPPTTRKTIEAVGTGLDRRARKAFKIEKPPTGEGEGGGGVSQAGARRISDEEIRAIVTRTEELRKEREAQTKQAHPSAVMGRPKTGPTQLEVARAARSKQELEVGLDRIAPRPTQAPPPKRTREELIASIKAEIAAHAKEYKKTQHAGSSPFIPPQKTEKINEALTAATQAEYSAHEEARQRELTRPYRKKPLAPYNGPKLADLPRDLEKDYFTGLHKPEAPPSTKGIPLRELPAKSAKTEHFVRVAPKKYTTPRAKQLTSATKQVQTEYPLKRTYANIKADRAGYENLGALMERVRTKGHTLTADDFKGMGFTPTTEERVRLAFEYATKQRFRADGSVLPRSYNTQMRRFLSMVDQLEGELFSEKSKYREGRKLGKPEVLFDRWGRLIGSRERDIRKISGGSKEPLLADVTKLLPEGKPTPFKVRTGPYPARVTTMEHFRIRELPDGKKVEEPVGSLGQVLKHLEKTYGIKFSPEWVLDKIKPVPLMNIARKKIYPAYEIGLDIDRELTKLMLAKRAEAKAKGNTQAVEKLDAALDRLYTKGTLALLGDVSKVGVGKLQHRLKFSEAGFEYPRLQGESNRKLAGGVPDTLNPNLPGTAKMKRKSKFRVADEEAIPEALLAAAGPSKKISERITKETKEMEQRGKGLRISRIPTSKVGSDLYARKGEAFTNILATPTIAGPRLREKGRTGFVAPRAAAEGEKATFVNRAVQESMEKANATIDRLGAEGRLHTVKEATADAIKHPGLEYRDLVEDLLGGTYAREVDFDNEYVLDQTKLAKMQAGFKKSAESEWEALQEEVTEASLQKQEGRATLQKGFGTKRLERLTEDKLSPATEEFLDKAAPYQLKGWKPKEGGGGVEPELLKWVKARATLGDIPKEEVPLAYQYLKEKQFKAERNAAKQPPPAPSSKFKPLPSFRVSQAGARALTPQEITALHKEIMKKNERAWEKSGKSHENAKKYFHTAGEWANATKSIVTAFDLSNPFRQTWQLTNDQIYRDLKGILHLGKKPQASFAKNTWDMLRAFGSADTAKTLRSTMEADPVYQMAKRAGVNFIEPGKKREDVWVGKEKLDKVFETIGKAIPASKHLNKLNLVDASSRAYDFYQNKAMRDGFLYGMEVMRHKAALDRSAVPNFETGVKDLTKFINDAGSRTKLTRSEDINKAASYVFYSPGMMRSRINMLTHLLIPSAKDVRPSFGAYETKAVRQYARMQSLHAIAGAVAGISAVSAIGAALGQEPQLELDPRSTDFLKIRMRNFSYDGWGGIQQYIRATAQILSARRKEVGSGTLVPQDPGTTFVKFARSKAGPGVGAVISAFFGRTSENKPVDLKHNPVGAAWQLGKDLVTPMSWSDFQDVMKEEPKMAWLVPLMLMGNGLQADLGPAGRWIDKKVEGQGPFASDQEMRGKYRELNKEFRTRHITGPHLSTRVSLPSRNEKGQKEHYTLSPSEVEEFEKEYMPLVTNLLTDFVGSKAYQSLPESKKSKALFNRVHALNVRYGATKMLKQQVWKKYKAGEIKPSGAEVSEQITEIPGLGKTIIPGGEKEGKY